MVRPGGTKTWRFQYRVLSKKYQQRKTIGNYPIIGVVEALKRAKKLSTKIYNGEYSKEAKKIEE